MEDNLHEEESPEEILKNYKAIHAVAWIFGVFLALLFLALVIDWLTYGFNFLIFVPIVLLPLWIVNVRMAKELKRKLK